MAPSWTKKFISTTICFKVFLSSIELLLNLWQKSVGYIHVVIFWDLYSVPLINVSTPSPILHSLDYCRYITLKIGWTDSSHLIFFFKVVLALLFLCLSILLLPMFTKKSMIFIVISFNPYVNLPIHEHCLSIYLDLLLFYSSALYSFSVHDTYMFFQIYI